jgi:hypothetical protein
MLIRFNDGVRFRLALTLVMVAMLCFVAPPGFIAFGHGEHTIECLAHVDTINHGMNDANEMDHQGGHSLPSGAHHPGSGCCGLFCMSALPAELDQNLQTAMAGPVRALPAERHLLSRAPEQPDRPPISLPVL